MCSTELTPSPGLPSMHIVVLTMRFSLPGCRSLKEKRQRMGGLHERYGRQPAVAVCESGDRDRVDASEWTFRSEEHTSELQSRENLVCRLLLEKKKMRIQ